jgi:hypothetical protein
LDAERRQLLWEHFDSSACGKQLRDEELSLYSFWKAVADRNVTRIRALGGDMLSGQTCQYSDEDCAYILTATAASLIAQNENEFAATLLRQHRSRAMQAKQYQIALQQLWAMSQSRFRPVQ